MEQRSLKQICDEWKIKIEELDKELLDASVVGHSGAVFFYERSALTDCLLQIEAYIKQTESNGSKNH